MIYLVNRMHLAPRARRDLQTRRNELGDEHSTPDEAAWAAQLDAAIAQLVAAGA